LFQQSFGAFIIMIVLIGMMMISSAKAFTQAAKRELILTGATARDAMAPPPVSIPSNISLTDSLDRYLRGHEHETFPVMDEFGRLIGALNYEAARRVGQTEPTRPVRDAMIPLSDLKVVQADLPLADVIAELGGAAALVVDGTALVGTISGHSINRWADSRQPGQNAASVSPGSPVPPSSSPPPPPPPPAPASPGAIELVPVSSGR
jgi:CBS domain-containing protein